MFAGISLTPCFSWVFSGAHAREPLYPDISQCVAKIGGAHRRSTRGEPLRAVLLILDCSAGFRCIAPQKPAIFFGF
jgi:hypothetical protein